MATGGDARGEAGLPGFGTPAFVARLATLDMGDVPPGIQAEARRLLLDQIACVVAARATSIAPVVRSGAEAIWPGGGAVGTAYQLARLGDALDFDEGAVGAHFGCGAVAAALALAPQAQATGGDLLAAIIAGFEAGTRIARATGSYYETTAGVQRFLPVWGIGAPVVLAAAMAACRILNLPARQTEQAVALACAHTPLPVGAKWSAMRDLPNTKYCDTGWATAAGVGAALLAQSGTTGLAGMFDAEGGIFTMMSAVNADVDALDRGLGTQWGLSQVRYKEWPCCGMLIGALRAARTIMASGDLSVPKIRRIEVWVPENTTLARFTNPDPQTFVSYQFSLPHAMAMLLCAIPPGPLWVDETLAARPDITALRQRVTVHPLTPRHIAQGITAEVQIHGQDNSQRAELPLAALAGSRPPSDDEGMIAKLRSQLAAPDAATIVALVAALPGPDPSAALLSAILEARPA